MTNLHPHWNTTEKSVAVETPVEQPIRSPAPRKEAPSNISRRPAAITGIVLVVFLGFAFYKGVGSLRGQIANTSTIHISSNGFIPDITVIDYGQTITWINDDTKPHTVTSSELCDAETGACLSLGPIAPGEQGSYAINESVEPSIFSYGIADSDAFFGQIVVGDASEFFNELSALTEEEGFEEPQDFSVGQPTTTNLPSTSPTTNTLKQESNVLQAPQETEDTLSLQAEVSASSRASLPENPYTQKNGAVPLYRNPLSQSDLHAGAPLAQHQPMRQPTTGSSFWLVGLLSIAGVLLFARRYLVKHA